MYIMKQGIALYIITCNTEVNTIREEYNPFIPNQPYSLGATFTS